MKYSIDRLKNPKFLKIFYCFQVSKKIVDVIRSNLKELLSTDIIFNISKLKLEEAVVYIITSFNNIQRDKKRFISLIKLHFDVKLRKCI